MKVNLGELQQEVETTLEGDSNRSMIGEKTVWQYLNFTSC